MNIEIANRLIELRKKSGLSQEELADRLGLSRQAVSKWERAEASPDTDNLICLARIYGVSLDDLLNTDESIEDIARNVKEERTSRGGPAGVRLTDDEGQAVEYDDEGITIVDKDGERLTIDEARKKYKRDPNKFALPVLIVCVYIFLGFYYMLWHPMWILFLLIPVYYAAVTPFKKKDEDCCKDKDCCKSSKDEERYANHKRRP